MQNFDLHKTLNHSSGGKLEWFQREYPDAIQFIKKSASIDDQLSFDACVAGKARRRPFVNLTQNRYAPLEAVSSDTTGPLTQEDSDGKTFLQLIKNAGFRYISGVAMKTKGGASNAIIKSLARLQVLCGKTANRLHTHGPGEENKLAIKNILSNPGTAHSTTVPNSSSTNAQVERRFETVFAAASTALKAAPPPLNSKFYWSIAALDAIGKQNYLPLKRGGMIHPSLNTTMQLH